MTKKTPNSTYILKYIFFAAFILTLCACTFAPKNYSVGITHSLDYTIWVDGIYFGDHMFPVGGHSGGLVIIQDINAPIPDFAKIRWQKMVHYTEYKNQKQYEVLVPIPKPLPPIIEGRKYHRFMFVINKDKTVTLHINKKMGTF